MARTTKTTIEETVDPDSRAVLAYRVGKLEEVSAAGFQDLKHELSNLINNFATNAKVDAAVEAGNKEHAAIKERVKKVENWLNWIARIIFSVVILAVLGLAIATNLVHH